jgi:hypothetical protein
MGMSWAFSAPGDTLLFFGTATVLPNSRSVCCKGIVRCITKAVMQYGEGLGNYHQLQLLNSSSMSCQLRASNVSGTIFVKYIDDETLVCEHHTIMITITSTAIIYNRLTRVSEQKHTFTDRPGWALQPNCFHHLCASQME